MLKSIRETYNIPNEAKVLLYVGNISQNKNQTQMVRAYTLLSDEMRKNTFVLFCGEDHVKDGMLQELISNAPNNSHLVLCGSVDKEDMNGYYKEADGVVLLSYTEGFGLSLVEGMHFGLPCAMPTDLDAFEDIYDECAVIGIDKRDDQTVANALFLLMSKVWDRDRIRNYSNKFMSIMMAEKYKEVYELL